MKHIKSYKLFESSEVVLVLQDICIELEHDGFDIEFENSDCIRSIIRIYRPNGDDFNYMKISESVNRVRRYLGDRLIKVKVAGGLSSSYLELYDDVNGEIYNMDKEIYEAVIEFKNDIT